MKKFGFSWFGLSILACAAASFAFPSAFTSWGGVKLTKLVMPAIQVIMFGMGTMLTLDDFVRVAKCPWAVATGVFLQLLVGAPFGMKYAEGYTVYDPPGNATEWNKPRQTILDGIGVQGSVREAQRLPQ